MTKCFWGGNEDSLARQVGEALNLGVSVGPGGSFKLVWGQEVVLSGKLN